MNALFGVFYLMEKLKRLTMCGIETLSGVCGFAPGRNVLKRMSSRFIMILRGRFLYLFRYQSELVLNTL